MATKDIDDAEVPKELEKKCADKQLFADIDFAILILGLCLLSYRFLLGLLVQLFDSS